MGIFMLTKTKLFILTRYQSRKIDINLPKNFNLVRVLLFFMRMQTFSVRLHLCKILKTKDCVPFEVQYTSNKLV